MMIINTSRVLEVSSSIRSIKNIIVELRKKDPQYLAVKNLVDSLGMDKASLLTIINSLISYQLSIPGEVYWERFSRYFSKPGASLNTSDLRKFLLETGCSRLLDQKMRRVDKILTSNIAEKLLINGLFYCDNVEALIKELSSTLNASKDSKTVVFAAKMYSYICDIAGKKTNLENIAIPVDYRNSLLALTSCIIVDCRGHSLRDCARKFSSSMYSKYVRDAWMNVCKLSGIPCLELDVFTWIFAGVAVKADFNVLETTKIFKEKYGVDLDLNVARILLECVENYVR